MIGWWWDHGVGCLFWVLAGGVRKWRRRVDGVRQAMETVDMNPRHGISGGASKATIGKPKISYT